MTRETLPPGPRFGKTLGTFNWVLRPGPYMEAASRRYGDMWTMTLARDRYVMVSDPELVKLIFTASPKQLYAGEANEVFGPVVGSRSVLLLDEEEHMTQRKLLLPPFHGKHIEHYAEIMREACERELETWPRDRAMPLLPAMQRITLEVIMRAVFGLSDEGGERQARLQGLLRQLLGWTATPSRALQFAMVVKLGGARAVARFGERVRPVHAALHAEIQLAREDPNLKERDDILALMIAALHEDGSPISDEEVRDQLMTLLLAGHETSATALAWAMERLLRHPEMLVRLRAEAEAGEDAYADAVVKETMRMRPIVPMAIRVVKQPFELGAYNLPAGTQVAASIYLVHRREDIYPEPLQFRPERFLEQPAGTYTWIPFGGGVRRCIGASFATQEMKIVLQTVAARAQLRAVRRASEGVRRRAITFSPSRGAEAILQELRPSLPEPVAAAAAVH